MYNYVYYNNYVSIVVDIMNRLHKNNKNKKSKTIFSRK